jgi:hypothetical protein
MNLYYLKHQPIGDLVFVLFPMYFSGANRILREDPQGFALFQLLLDDFS